MIVPLPLKNGKIRAGVHDGSFHPDDVVCAALLMRIYRYHGEQKASAD